MPLRLHYIVGLLFTLLLLNSGCKSKKQLLIPAIDLTKTEVDSLIFSKNSFNWFDGKAKIKFEDNYETQRGVLYVRMKSDSVIWMVVKKLSIEAARVQITPEAICILNRLEKTYQQAPLDSISHVFGLSPDFDFISELISGRLPQIDTSRLWKFKENDTFYQYRSVINDIVIDFNYDKKTGLLTSGKFYDRHIQEGEWTYGDYRRVSDEVLPFERKFRIKFDDKKYMNLDIDFQEININKAHNLRFEIPPHYKKIE